MTHELDPLLHVSRSDPNGLLRDETSGHGHHRVEARLFRDEPPVWSYLRRRPGPHGLRPTRIGPGLERVTDGRLGNSPLLAVPGQRLEMDHVAGACLVSRSGQLERAGWIRLDPQIHFRRDAFGRGRGHRYVSRCQGRQDSRCVRWKQLRSRTTILRVCVCRTLKGGPEAHSSCDRRVAHG